jgi:two-component system OmpR family sensor kinase/two-component system sensor histidine kinase BaeS
LAVGLLLGLVFSRTLTAPLQRLAAAARVVATGDFSQRVAVEGSAEVAEVSQAFNEMSAALEKAERQRQNLVADVAHELRTPLSVLQGNLRAILDDVYPLDKAEISRLHDQTLLLSRLVGDLRELALADAGRLHLNLQATNVVQVVRTTTESMSQGANHHEVSLTILIPDDLPVVQADPDRLAQVLHNLLVNAFRHTPSGGSVTVQASVIGDAVEIAVADTGEGIAPEDLPHIFDRFWQADRSRARDERRAGGAGLGLSIAKSLVEAHGGRIWAESTPGEGVTFLFTLPLENDPGNATLVADELGFTAEELMSELENGKSIADLANERGVGPQIIADALMAQRAEKLAQSVAEGRITKEQADQVLQRMEEKGLDAFLFGPPAGFEPPEGRFERQSE